MGVYYATVRKSGKISDVKVRDRQDRNYYTSNRASANFSSSGHPVRPPRKTKTSGYDVGAHYASSKVTSDYRSSPSEKYYFGSTAPIKHGNGQLNRSFSSVQNLNRKSFNPSLFSIKAQTTGVLQNRHIIGAVEIFTKVTKMNI